jgi:hypothetical protein
MRSVNLGCPARASNIERGAKLLSLKISPPFGQEIKSFVTNSICPKGGKGEKLPRSNKWKFIAGIRAAAYKN